MKCAALGSLEIQDAKMMQKNCHLRTIAQVCRAESLQLRRVSTIGKKNLLGSNISSTCPHNRLTSGWDRLGSLGHPTNFNGFCVLALLLQRCLSPANQTKLCTMFGRLLGC